MTPVGDCYGSRAGSANQAPSGQDEIASVYYDKDILDNQAAEAEGSFF